MVLDIKIELKNIILSVDKLKTTYVKKHSNTKYSLDLIINEILYFIKSGVSWRMLRSTINYKTLHWHYTLLFTRFCVQKRIIMLHSILHE